MAPASRTRFEIRMRVISISKLAMMQLTTPMLILIWSNISTVISLAMVGLSYVMGSHDAVLMRVLIRSHVSTVLRLTMVRLTHVM